MKATLSELQDIILNGSPNEYLRNKIGNALLVTLSQGIRDGVYPDNENNFGEFGAFTNPTQEYLSAALSHYAELVDCNEELTIKLDSEVYQ